MQQEQEQEQTPEEFKQEVFEYLDNLRESGETNMFGATPYIQGWFGLAKTQARDYLLEWMKTFEERHQIEVDKPKSLIEIVEGLEKRWVAIATLIIGSQSGEQVTVGCAEFTRPLWRIGSAKKGGIKMPKQLFDVFYLETEDHTKAFRSDWIKTTDDLTNHVLVGQVFTNNVAQVFSKMQAEAHDTEVPTIKHLISLGVSRQSMAVGDAIRTSEGEYWIVQSLGWRHIPHGKEVSE